LALSVQFSWCSAQLFPFATAFNAPDALVQLNWTERAKGDQSIGKAKCHYIDETMNLK
jgi:hypothetical protein